MGQERFEMYSVRRLAFKAVLGFAVSIVGIWLVTLLVGCAQPPRARVVSQLTASRGGSSPPAISRESFEAIALSRKPEMQEVTIRVPEDVIPSVFDLFDFSSVQLVALERGMCGTSCFLGEMKVMRFPPSKEWTILVPQGTRIAIGLRFYPARDYCEHLRVKRAGVMVRTIVELTARITLDCVHQIQE
ncbi:hypothetical protein EXS71_02365 [Candidatus Uhrbacteria bacterium]|nr:hypothetical protein [Candidatus Uhrbacteria bacterium]